MRPSPELKQFTFRIWKSSYRTYEHPSACYGKDCHHYSAKAEELGRLF